ncbi:hypothetical protein, partial [Phocaeicola vulgatus]|uniref:hypothetical protein n=1 Tax=Phocaeicola vulgatus TaxID=821 RepID=UPI001C6FF3CE
MVYNIVFLRYKINYGTDNGKKRKKTITAENSNPYHIIILSSDLIRYYGYVLGFQKSEESLMGVCLMKT